MHNYTLPMLAALACAVCNGTAAVLQKISADTEKNVQSLDAGLLLRLFQNVPYVSGVALDLLGWLLTLYAVRFLPLFFVEAIVASSIIVTAIVARIFGHEKLYRRSYIAISLILFGLVMLAFAASTEPARTVGNVLRWVIAVIPLPVAAVGFFIARSKKYWTAISLAALGGLSFGNTSVIGRIISFRHPWWHSLYDPLVYSLIVSGVLGILLFSIALQRARATTINATMTVSQTVIPALIGVLFLGDSARQGLGFLAVAGIILSVGGVLYIALSPKRTA